MKKNQGNCLICKKAGAGCGEVMVKRLLTSPKSELKVHLNVNEIFTGKSDVDNSF